MAVPSTRVEFREYCLRRLGKPNASFDNFYHRCSINKYAKWYFSIIFNALDRDLSKKTADQYVEMHHYIPKSLGGSEQDTVYLTAREHFVCHILLTKMLEGEDKAKMSLALHRLLNGNQKNYCKSSIFYEKIKLEHSKACSLRNIEYWSQFTKEQRSAMRSGINNSRYGKEVKESTRQKISKANKGRLTGNKHPLWKIGHSEESKRKMSLTKRTNQIKGKKWFNNGLVETFDLPENKPDNFVFGRLIRRKGN